MKKAVAILIFCSLLLQCLAHYSAIALFELRKEYIARNLCINRDKPALKCCGKCYLKKQLQKVDESHRSTGTASSKTEHREDFVIYILPAAASWASGTFLRSSGVFNPAGQQLHGYAPLSRIFRPPPVFI